MSTDTHETNHLTPNQYRQVEKQVHAHLGDTFPAIALAVIHNNQVIFNGAWGWIDPETKHHTVRANTYFDLASLTKLFTETAFLQCVAAEKVRLDDPLVNVIPEFAARTPRPIEGGKDPHTNTPLPTPPENIGKTVNPAYVTFRHLLTHTSGLPPWQDVYTAAGPIPPPPTERHSLTHQQRWRNGLNVIVNYPFIDLVGRAVHYSDIGLLLLGEACVRLTDGATTLADVIITMTRSLNLHTVTYNPMQHQIPQKQIAPTEFDKRWRKRRVWGEVHDENACGIGGIAGHAGLFATALDIANFGNTWLNQNGTLLLTDEIYTQALTNQSGDTDYPFGLGWRLNPPVDSPCGDLFSPLSFGHTGFTGTSLWIDPERRLVVALLTNRVYPGRERIGIHAFRRAMHDTIVQVLTA